MSNAIQYRCPVCDHDDVYITPFIPLEGMPDWMGRCLNSRCNHEGRLTEFLRPVDTTITSNKNSRSNISLDPILLTKLIRVMEQELSKRKKE